ncbi:Cysteinyl-tRNA synthetase [Chitinispirillum alkaliphilum]|nr:Cysteinyl-tRNA synthetase [Chitinispirillum alkaliphilum]
MKKKLTVYNTATRVKEPFEPLHEKVNMYCCGPTVYNYAHIGNLRTYIFEDVLKRTLLALGYKVKHVVNITDVGHLTSDADTGEDKMESGALREGKTVWDIAEFYTSEFMRNFKELNLLKPDLWPKATSHISHMIDMIQALEKKGYTYITGDGVYFDTTRFEKYCDFAQLDAESLRAGERVEMGDKRAVTDFALWKFSPKDKKRQMEWESPWGTGFPGWHIECSAMALAYLKVPLDIHCGGMDHIRVHHSNEIAQSEAAMGKPFAKYWLHGEFLVLDKGKMAKSGGNFITLDALKKEGISPAAYKMFCYSAHYRSPLTFSWEGVRASAQSLRNMLKAMAVLGRGEGDAVSQSSVKDVLGEFWGAVCDDLNMPRAVAAVWDILKNDKLTQGEKISALKVADSVLGLDLFAVDGRNETIEEINGHKIKIVSTTQLSASLRSVLVEEMVRRRVARAERNYSLADDIREKFALAGVAVKDLPDGSSECLVEDSAKAQNVLLQAT